LIFTKSISELWSDDATALDGITDLYRDEERLEIVDRTAELKEVIKNFSNPVTQGSRIQQVNNLTI
jgi:hypothetical protein